MDWTEHTPINKFDETQNTHYYQINGNIISLSFFMTDADEDRSIGWHPKNG